MGGNLCSQDLSAEKGPGEADACRSTPPVVSDVGASLDQGAAGRDLAPAEMSYRSEGSKASRGPWVRAVSADPQFRPEHGCRRLLSATWTEDDCVGYITPGTSPRGKEEPPLMDRKAAAYYSHRFSDAAERHMLQGNQAVLRYSGLPVSWYQRSHSVPPRWYGWDIISNEDRELEYIGFGAVPVHRRSHTERGPAGLSSKRERSPQADSPIARGLFPYDARATSAEILSDRNHARHEGRAMRCCERLASEPRFAELCEATRERHAQRIRDKDTHRGKNSSDKLSQSLTWHAGTQAGG